jgi:hypothetical protein
MPFQHAIEIIEGVPAQFVFNVDEMRRQNWSDRTKETWLMPIYHAEKRLDIPVSYRSERIALMACVAPECSGLRPEINPTMMIDVDLALIGLTSKKVSIRSQLHGFVKATLFNPWSDTIFLPELIPHRAKYEYNVLVILILDICFTHVNHQFQKSCGTYRVVPCYFPLHGFI